MRLLLRAPLIASAFFFFWGGAFLFAWVVIPVLRLTSKSRERERETCQRLQHRAFRLFHGYMRALGLIRVTVDAAEGGQREGPAVLVANHPTLVDTTAILASYGDLTCVVKSSLINNPFVGPMIRACGHIDAGDGAGLGGAAALERAVDCLRDGRRLLIFPEGTRSPPGGMGDFKRGAFEIAARADVPVVPLFLTCDPPALTKGLPFWAQPDRLIHLAVLELPAISPANEIGGSKALRKRVEEAYRFRLYSRGPQTKPDGPAIDHEKT